MDKRTYDALIEQSITDAIGELLPRGAGPISEVRLRSTLTKLAQRVANHTRAYELLGIRTSEELAEEWNVSKRGVQKRIEAAHARFGVGRKIGRDWVLSAAEVEQYAPPPPGRPASE